MQAQQPISSKTKPITGKAHPFYSNSYLGHDCYAQSVPDRLERVAHFDLNQCQQALQISPMQKSVITAIERRIRQLQREAKRTDGK